MCRILDKRRLQHYFNPQYKAKLLYKNGDTLWTFCRPPGMERTHFWLLYTVKVLRGRVMRLRCDDIDKDDKSFKRTVEFPVYDVRYAWKDRNGLYKEETVDEKHLYDPRTMTEEEEYCIVGLNNQIALSEISSVRRDKMVPGEGLVYLSKARVEWLRIKLTEEGILAQHENEYAEDVWHFSWTNGLDTDDESELDSDDDCEWRSSADDIRRPRKRKGKARRQKQPLPSDKPIRACRITLRNNGNPAGTNIPMNSQV